MVKVWYENPEGAAPAQGQYSHVGCIEGGRTVHLAGQLSVGADGGIVGAGDFDAQFMQVFGNIAAVLAGIGCDFRSVIKFTTYLTNADDIANFKRLRGEHFPGWFSGDVLPPNTLLVIDRLVNEDFLLEVEAIAGAD